MCKILIGIKTNDSQNVKFEKIIRAQEHSLSDQPHGISALIVDKWNNISVKKELNEYGKVFIWVRNRIRNAKIVAIHTRQATDGEIDEANLHFFNVKDYFFAHNGIVGKYSKCCVINQGQRRFFSPTGKTFKVEGYADDMISELPGDVEKALEKEAKEEKNKMSDSYNFLLNIPKPITKLRLIEEIENKNFIGMGVLFGKNEKKMTVFATREMKAHTDFKNYFFVYSYDPINVLSDIRSILGFQTMVKDKSEKLRPYNVSAGIYEVGFNQLFKRSLQGKEVKTKSKKLKK